MFVKIISKLYEKSLQEGLKNTENMIQSLGLTKKLSNDFANHFDNQKDVYMKTYSTKNFTRYPSSKYDNDNLFLRKALKKYGFSDNFIKKYSPESKRNSSLQETLKSYGFSENFLDDTLEAHRQRIKEQSKRDTSTYQFNFEKENPMEMFDYYMSESSYSDEDSVSFSKAEKKRQAALNRKEANLQKSIKKAQEKEQELIDSHKQVKSVFKFCSEHYL